MERRVLEKAPPTSPELLCGAQHPVGCEWGGAGRGDPSGQTQPF